MPTAARLALFLAVAAAVFGIAFAVGAASPFGPDGTEPATEHREDHG